MGVIPRKTKIFFVIIVVVLAVLIFLLYLAFNSSYTKTNLTIAEDALYEGILAENLAKGSTISFDYDLENYEFIIDSIGSDSVLISGDFNKDISIGGEFSVGDVSISLQNIENSKATFYLIRLEVEECIENWECSDWGPCIDGTIERICLDLNACGTNFLEPGLEAYCPV